MRAKTHVHNRSLESIDVDRLQCGMPAAGEGAEAARPFWRRWSTLLQVFNESARDSTVTLWAIVVACAPLFYVLVVTLPRPLGLGLQWGNDFPDHRIWWTQVETFFWSHGFFPQWNPTVDLGYPYMASAFGTGALYPLRWWTYLPTYFGGFWSYVAQYVQVIFHASLALLGIFALLVRFARVHPSTAALTTLFVLLNQCFNNLLRFPNGLENFAWMTWVLYFTFVLCGTLNDNCADFTRSSRMGSMVGCSLCLCLSWITGYGQFSMVFLFVIAAIVIAAYRTRADFMALGSSILTGTVSAVGSIFPAIDWVRSDPLRSGQSVADINAVGVSSLWSVLSNPFGLDVHYEYFTFPSFLLLVAAGCWVVLVKRRTRASLAMLAALVVIGDISRGTDGLLFVPMYEHVPFFSAFNSPSKDMWVAFVPMAWLAAVGVEHLATHGRLRAMVLSAVWASTAVLLLAYNPNVSLADTGIWKPLERAWIDPEASTVAYRALLLGSSIAVSVWLLLRSTLFRCLAATVLVAVFVVAFAQHTTWLTNGLDARASTPISDAYPQGLLGPRQGDYVGMMGIGVVAPNVNPRIWDLLVGHGTAIRGSQDAQFPNTRFWWRPLDPQTSVRVRLVTAGPNHLTVSVDATGPGDLVYLAEFSPLMKVSAPVARDTPFSDFYRVTVVGGQQVLSFDFMPWSYVAAEVATLAMTSTLAALWLVSRGRRRLAPGLCLVAGTIAVAWLVFGSTTRHSLGARELYGVSGPPNAAVELVTSAGPNE